MSGNLPMRRREENAKVRYSAAYPTGRERIEDFSPNLFWDADPADLDFVRNRRYIVQRVLERGTVSDLGKMFRLYGMPGVVATAKTLRVLEPRALSFVACIADEPKENFRCYTQRQSFQAPWIY